MVKTKIAAPWLSRMKRQHRYSPVGRCIYHDGGDWVGRLTLEHVIPEGLGGMLGLPDATCDACANITSAMEGQNAGRLFRPIRRQLKFPSKGRGKARREPPASDDLHEIAILPPGQIGAPKLVVVRVRLFANVEGMATHYVVAGERL